MTNGRLWLVVKPTVGLPLFFIGVALTALAVHFAILTNTTWFAKYWEGKKVASVQIEAPLNA
jgi:light-harvesting protein B-800-850 alpha chain